MLNAASLWHGHQAPAAAATATGGLCPCTAPGALAVSGGVQQQHQLVMPGTQPALQTMISSSRIGTGGGKVGPVSLGPGAMSSGTRCHFCKEVIASEQFIRTDIMVCHIECFRCSVCCAVMLGMRAFRLGNRVCCQACYRILTVCAYCGGPVMNGKSWVEYENRAYHPNHLFCSEPGCGVVLCFETGFALSSSKLPVCPAHHPDAVSCAVCGCPVTGEGVQLNDRMQLTLRHPECFMCSLCGFLLSWEYIIDQYGRPLCCEHIDMAASFMRIADPVPTESDRKKVTIEDLDAQKKMEIEALEDEIDYYRPSIDQDELLVRRRSRVQKEVAGERRGRASRDSHRRKSKVHKEVVREWHDRKRRRSHRRRSRQPSRRTSLRRRKSDQPGRSSALPKRGSALRKHRSALPDGRSDLSKRRSTLPERRSALPARKSASPARKSALPVRKSVLPVRKSVLPVRKSVLPERQTALPERQTALPFWSVGQPTRKSALPFRKSALKARKTGFPAGKVGFSGNKFKVKSEKTAKGPDKLGLKKVFQVAKKQPPTFVFMHNKAAKKGRGMPRAQRHAKGFHGSHWDGKNNLNASASDYEGVSQTNQSDASESIRDASDATESTIDDATESTRDDATESTRDVSGSTGDTSESIDDASESIDDASESVNDASESVNDATESTSDVFESRDGSASKLISDASRSANNDVLLILSARSDDRIEYCRASSDDLEDVEGSCQLRHCNAGEQQRDHFDVSEVDEGSSSSFSTGDDAPSIRAKRHHPANLNVSYASFFETSSESLGV